jgi:hypothetical protein
MEEPLWQLIKAYQDSVTIAQERKIRKIVEQFPRIDLEKWK